MSAPAIRTIVTTVADHYGVRRDDILSQRLTREIIRPRQLCMYLARRLTPLSLPAIGRHLGGRDHTTIRNGVARIELALAGDPDLGRSVAHLVDVLADLPDERPERDPAEVAIDVVCGLVHATNLSVMEIEALARLAVGWGRSLGAIAVEGDPDGADVVGSEPTAELAPALAGLRRSFDAWALARATRHETTAADTLAAALRNLFDAVKEA